MVCLFKAAGSTFFLFPEDDTARRLFNGKHGNRIVRINPEIRGSVPIPFDEESIAKFFNNSIYGTRYEELFESFKIPKSIEHDNSILILSLTLMFKEFCTKPEDEITKDVKDFYEENLLDATTIETLNDSKMIFELHNTCPMCLKSQLTIRKKDELLHNFKVVNIYPKNPGSFLRSYIENTHPLIGNINDSKNKIILCKKCAKKYESTPSSDGFERLYTIRQHIDTKLDYVDDDTNIYDSIRDLINKIVIIKDFEKLPKLELQALKIKQKIQQKTDLYEDVMRKVLKFYPTVDSYLKSKEFEEIDQSTNFSKIIKKRSDNYIKNGFNEGEVIYTLADDLAKIADPVNPAKFRNEAFILVCYFVQHCEVLSYEISK